MHERIIELLQAAWIIMMWLHQYIHDCRIAYRHFFPKICIEVFNSRLQEMRFRAAWKLGDVVCAVWVISPQRKRQVHAPTAYNRHATLEWSLQIYHVCEIINSFICHIQEQSNSDSRNLTLLFICEIDLAEVFDCDRVAGRTAVQWASFLI